MWYNIGYAVSKQSGQSSAREKYPAEKEEKMSKITYDRARIQSGLTEKLARYFGVTPDEANKEQERKDELLNIDKKSNFFLTK